MLFYAVSFFFFTFLKQKSYVIRHENLPKIKLKHSLVLYGLQNLKIFMPVSDCIIWNLPNYVDYGVSPKVWTGCGVFNVCLVGWTMENVSFDCIYSLGQV